MNPFEQKLAGHGVDLRRTTLVTLQVNLGRKCNQACRHCHVNAAPWRTEMMSAEVAARVAEWIREHRPDVVDLTGGAPELSPFFRPLVTAAVNSGCRVIDRNNLTILEEPGFEDLVGFLAGHRVEVIASLPCYSAENVNRQRGNGVFEKSIRGLQRLNAAGYGRDPRLLLDLVYNPLGPKLPPPQDELERDYREALRQEFGIEFNRLFTLTNQPIARFAEDLHKQGRWDEYVELLLQNFNPDTLPGLMCRSTLSVSYTGELYDCDFNQMLDLPTSLGKSRHLWEITPADVTGLGVRTGLHCLACTAGSGSSCTGALVT